jgi:uncharacterized protein (TIRG00374 family)
MNKTHLRWALHVLQYTLCVVAIIYLVRTVPWRDYVHLADGQRVRLVAQRGETEFVIQRSAEAGPETVGKEAIHCVRVNDRDVPEIEQGIATVLRTTDKMKALWAILLFLPVVIIQSGRLAVMLAIQEVRLPLWVATKLTFVGNFFNFALPGTTGGDLIKAYYITQYTPRKTEVVTTVFLDRAIGLFGLVILAGVSILLTRNPQQFGQVTSSLAIICAVLAVGSIIVFSRRVREALELRALANLLPAAVRDQVLRVGRATVAMRHHKPLVLLSLGMTVVLQAMVMISAVVMARALGMEGDASYFFIYVSIGFLIAAIPVTPPQAFGVMEYFYVLFFTQRGMNNDPSQAVALALALRLTQLVWSLPGVLVPLLGAHRPSKAELAALEEARPEEAAGGAAAAPAET